MMSTPRPEQEVFDDLAALTATPGFAHVIAYFCMRDNFTWHQDEMRAEDLQHLYSPSRLIRTEMSTLVGLMVRSGANLDAPPPTDATSLAKRAEDLLEELHLSLSRPIFDALMTGFAEGPAIDPWQGGGALREPIFYGGEGAFSFQNCDFAAEKYADDNAWLVANRGAPIDDMIAVAKAIATVEADKLSAAVHAGATRVGDVRLLEAFTFTIDDIAAHVALDRPMIEACVAAFALAAGNTNSSFRTLSDFNTVNAAPILPLEDGRHLLYHFNALAEALYESPFYWLGADKSYEQTAFKHRGDFTEAFALARLTRVFGAARVYRGINIERGKGDTVGEIDVLALFADRAIVLQAKSKRLTLAARKGNDLQLRGDFKVAVQDAYDQAVDCAAALSDPALRLVVNATGEEIAVLHPLARIYPVCLVADHYPALAFQTDQFLVTREVAGVAPPLVIDVFTLDTMAEFLERPLRFLSYLDLRALYGARVHIHHEITLLSYHLKHNLWLDDEYSFVALHDDFAADTEIAMGVRRLGQLGRATPEGILTLLEGTALDAILLQIERDPTGAMVDMALKLLQLSGKGLGELRDGVDMVLENARQRGRSDFVLGFDTTGLAIHANYDPPTEAAERLDAHMLVRKYRQKAESWFGLLLSPTTGAVRLGRKVAFRWRHDAKFERASRDLGRARLPVNVRRKADRPARNAPCHCGSGIKYKKCHLAADEGR